jgi:WD40 repeat protein
MNSDALAARIGNLLGSKTPGSASGSAAESLPPPLIPNHELIARIGGGSYGEVWLARSVTGALRAVKIVWRARFSSERPYEREFRGIVQFEPISRLHPGVVNVLHVGRDDAAGCFFYVMELADPVSNSSENGKPETQNSKPETYSPRTLASELKARTRLLVTDVVSLGVQLASALGHLHRQGLVHRDVKPSNVIFVQGQPKLADIGLVTGVNEERSFVGTEGFIPPEGPGSVRADLFALGRLLYEAATGKNRCDFPCLPDDLDRWPTNEREGLIELNEILARACAADPKDRHANAAEFAGDLNVILAGRSVRRAYGIERRLRRARRLSSVALVAVAIAVVTIWFQRWQRDQMETRAARERALRHRAEAAERGMEQQLYAALLEQARGSIHGGELGQRVRALETIRRAAAISNTVELRQAAFAALALPDLRLEREIAFAQNDGGQVCDPSFNRYAICSGRGPVEIRAIADDRLLVSLPAAAPALGYVKYWSPDGRYLAIKRDLDSSGLLADLEAWNLVTTQRVLHARGRATALALAFHPALPYIAAGQRDGDITIWDLESERELHQFHVPANMVYRLSFSPDGKQIAVASHEQEGNNTVAIIDATTGTAQKMIPCSNIVADVVWHPQGRWIAIPDFSGQVRLVDSTTGESQILGQHKAQAVFVTFNPAGDFLFSGGWEGELICWDMRSRKRALTIGLNSSRAQFSSDGLKCAIQMPDRLQIYDFQAPSACRELAGDLGQGVLRGAFSSDGYWFAAGGARSMGVWNCASPGPAATIPTGENHAGIPFFSPTSSEIYAYGNGALARWSIDIGDEGDPPELTRLPLLVPNRLQWATIRSNELVSICVGSVCFMPLGNTNTKNLRCLTRAATSGSVSPDGRWLGVRDFWGPTVRIYRLPDMEKVADLTNRANVCDFAFSPDKAELAVLTANGLEFYDTTNWQRSREMPIHSERFGSIFFTPDGKSFWLRSDRRTAALWDARTLEMLLPLPPDTTPLALSADGRHLAVSVDLRRVQLWDLEQVREQFRELGLDWEESRPPIRSSQR